MKSAVSRQVQFLVAGAIAVVLALASAGCTAKPASATPDFARTIATGEHALQDSLNATGANSISIALTDANGVVWRAGVGKVNSAGETPTALTRYGIGSVSKMVTTIAVMQLVEAGKVTLDTPVADVISDFSMADPAYRQITVRMLLNHSAGFPGTNYANGFAGDAYPDYSSDVLQLLRSQRLKSAPGVMSVYCNDCFTLAEVAVERLSGTSFTDYVAEHIFQPLGMSHSGLSTQQVPAAEMARTLGAGGAVRDLEVTNVLGSGAVVSTVEDMSRLARMLIGKGAAEGATVLSAQSVAEMGRLQRPSDPVALAASDFDYGLGWDVVDWAAFKGVANGKDLAAWCKGGDTGDYHAGFVVLPESGLAVTVLAAGASYSSSKAEALAQRVLLQALVDTRQITALPDLAAAAIPPVADATALAAADVAGVYLGTPGLAFRISRSAGGFIVESLGAGSWQSPAVVSLHSDGSLWPSPEPASASTSFRILTHGAQSFLVVSSVAGAGHYRSEMILGERVAPGAALTSQWKQRLGTWLEVGDQPSSLAWMAPATQLTEIPDLAGYLMVHTDSDAAPVLAEEPKLARMFLKVPLAMGRDLNDLRVLNANMMQFGGHLLRSADSVPVWSGSADTIVIGKQGYAEWRRMPADSENQLSISGTQAYRVYDPNFTLVSEGTSGAAGIPSGGWLVVFGLPGTQVELTPAG